MSDDKREGSQRTMIAPGGIPGRQPLTPAAVSQERPAGDQPGNDQAAGLHTSQDPRHPAIGTNPTLARPAGTAPVVPSRAVAPSTPGNIARAPSHAPIATERTMAPGSATAGVPRAPSHAPIATERTMAPQGVQRIPSRAPIATERTMAPPATSSPRAPSHAPIATERTMAPQGAQWANSVEPTNAAVPTYRPGQLAIGDQVGNFELIRELGRGGMGQVFLARDTKLGRLVALKVLTMAMPDLAERLLEEARATARCNHENIVILYEANEHNGVPYMALEFLEGQSLFDAIAPGPMSIAQGTAVMTDVVRALVRAAEFNIVHCDLKPENVFLTKTGGVKVLDFGIARLAAEATGEEGVSGTIPYMSPEQWGIDAIDGRTDIWAVGIIFWAVLTGSHPVSSDMTIAQAVETATTLDTPLAKIRSRFPAVPAKLGEIIDKCLAKRKADRWPDAKALLAALADLSSRSVARQQLAEGASPYPGMAAFQEEDHGRFFGRDQELANAMAKLRSQAMMTIAAPSGVGKSSFVRAGLIPLLKSTEPWEIVVMRPGKQPVDTLAQALVPVLRESGDLGRLAGGEAKQILVARIRKEPGYLASAMREWARAASKKLLLFVDQFEECVTQCNNLDERHAFLVALAAIADDPSSPLRVLTTVRSDFLDRIAEDAEVRDQVASSLYFLGVISEAGMKEALVRPLEPLGFGFEDDQMVEEMVGSLRGTRVALPLLQFAADAMWDKRDTARRVLSRAAYEELGGVTGALAVHADRVLEGLPPSSKPVAKEVLKALISSDGTREAVEVSDLARLGNPQAVRGVVDHFVNGRLLTLNDESQTVELVHECLVTQWPTLRRIREESGEEAGFIRQLSAAAKQWDAKGRAVGLLWTGDAANEAIGFAKRSSATLPEREQAFLDQVLGLAAKQKARKRNVLIAAFAGMSLLVVASLVGIVMVRGAERKAKAETVRAVSAEKQAQASLDKALAAEAARLEAMKNADAANADLAKTQKMIAEIEGKLNSKPGEAMAQMGALVQRITELQTQAEAAQAAAEQAKSDAELAVRALQEERKVSAAATASAVTSKKQADAAVVTAKEADDRAVKAEAERLKQEAARKAEEERKRKEAGTVLGSGQLK